MSATANKLSAIAKVLIDSNADLGVQNEDLKTALMYAIEFSPEIATMIIERGGDFEIQDLDDNTALMYASEYNMVLAKLLIKKAHSHLGK